MSEITERLWTEYEGFAQPRSVRARHRLPVRRRHRRAAAAGPAARGGAGRLGHRRGRAQGAACAMAGSKEDTETVRAFFQDMRAPRARRSRARRLATARPASSGRSRSASRARPDSAAWRTDAQPRREGARPICGPSSRPASRPATRRPRGRSPAISPRASALTMPTAAECRCLLRGRLRSLHRASAPASHASTFDTHDEPPRKIVRRGAAPAEDHSERLRREAGLKADVRRPDARRRALARSALHRVRTSSARSNPRGPRQRLRRPQCAGGNCAPIAFIQQSADLTWQGPASARRSVDKRSRGAASDLDYDFAHNAHRYKSHGSTAAITLQRRNMLRRTWEIYGGNRWEFEMLPPNSHLHAVVHASGHPHLGPLATPVGGALRGSPFR